MIELVKQGQGKVNTTDQNLTMPKVPVLLVVICLCMPPLRVDSGGQVFLFEPLVIVYAFTMLVNHRNQPLYVPGWIAFQLLFIVFAFFSMMLSCLRNDIQVSESFLKIVRIAELLAVFYTVFVSVKTQCNINKFLNMIMFFGTLSSLIGVVGFVFQIPDLVAYQRVWSDVAGFGGMYRAGSFFQNTGVFGSLCCLLSMFSFALLLSDNTSINKRIAVLCAGSNIIGLFCSLSRAGIVAFLVGAAILYCIQLYRAKNVLVLLGTTLVLVCIVSFTYFTIPFIHSFIESRIADLFAVLGGSLGVADVSSGRVELWSSSLYEYAHSNIDVLVFGQGFAVDTEGLLFVDNNYLYLVIKGGLLTAIFWHASLICIILKIISQRTNTLRMPMLCVCGSLLTLMFFGDIWTVLPVMSVFMVLFACFSRLTDSETVSNATAIRNVS